MWRCYNSLSGCALWMIRFLISNHHHVNTQRSGLGEVGRSASTEDQARRSQTVRDLPEIFPPISLYTCLGNTDHHHVTSERNRLLKEHNLYRKEAEEHERKVDGKISENCEEWDIKIAVRPVSRPAMRSPHARTHDPRPTFAACAWWRGVAVACVYRASRK